MNFFYRSRIYSNYLRLYTACARSSDARFTCIYIKHLCFVIFKQLLYGQRNPLLGSPMWRRTFATRLANHHRLLEQTNHQRSEIQPILETISTGMQLHRLKINRWERPPFLKRSSLSPDKRRMFEKYWKQIHSPHIKFASLTLSPFVLHKTDDCPPQDLNECGYRCAGICHSWRAAQYECIHGSDDTCCRYRCMHFNPNRTGLFGR